MRRQENQDVPGLEPLPEPFTFGGKKLNRFCGFRSYHRTGPESYYVASPTCNQFFYIFFTPVWTHVTALWHAKSVFLRRLTAKRSPENLGRRGLSCGKLYISRLSAEGVRPSATT